VVSGELKIEFPDKVELLEEGELLVVPHGLKHKPIAEEEAKIMLFGPKGTKNTGNVNSEMTIETRIGYNISRRIAEPSKYTVVLK